MKVRIVSDGEKTRVETENGKLITGVESVHVFARESESPKAVITIAAPEVDIEADRIGRGRQHGEQRG